MTSWLGAAGLTTIELVGTEVNPPPVNLSESVSALLSARFGERRHAARDRRGGRPLERAGAAGERRGHHGAVVAGLEIAVLVLFVEDRLSCERLPGGGRRRRLLDDDQLAGRRRADDDGAGGRRGQAAAGELERDGLGLVVGQAGERRHAARDGGGGRPLERAGAAGERGRDHRAVVAGLQVAVRVLFVDHRLSGERLPGGRRRRRLGVDDQLAGRRRADDDAAGDRRGQAAAGELERDGLGLVVGQVR